MLPAVWWAPMHDAPPSVRRGWGVSGVTRDDGGYAVVRRSRPPIPPGRVVAGAGARSARTSSAPPAAARRKAETRVRRAPRFALQPRSNRSGAHNPIGRQAMARPSPKFGSQCAACARSGSDEMGIIND